LNIPKTEIPHQRRRVLQVLNEIARVSDTATTGSARQPTEVLTSQPGQHRRASRAAASSVSQVLQYRGCAKEIPQPLASFHRLRCGARDEPAHARM